MKKDSSRFIYIDLLRGWALIVMIEVHIFNSLLIPELKETTWFSLLNFVNGLVAPAFLFVSGFAFIISSERKLDELRKYKKYFWNKLNRIGLIFLAGYSLHLPFFSFSKMIGENRLQNLITWFNVDILQCIAAGLLLLLVLRIVIKNDKFFYGLLITLMLIIWLGSPVIWKINFSNYLPLFFADYFNPMQGSYFPLFPWLFFLLAGAVFSKAYTYYKNENREKEFINKIFLYSLIPIFLTHVLFSDIFYSSIFIIRPNPFFLIQRLGYILLLASFFWHYSSNRQNKTSFVLDVSRESLLIYWLHLQIIYSIIWGGRSLVEIVDSSFSATECVLATLILIILMVFAAKSWKVFKMKYPSYARPITGGIIVISTLLFLLI